MKCYHALLVAVLDDGTCRVTQTFEVRLERERDDGRKDPTEEEITAVLLNDDLIRPREDETLLLVEQYANHGVTVRVKGL